jgi:hypothetical protein
MTKHIYVLAMNASDAAAAIRTINAPLSVFRYLNDDRAIRGLTNPLYIVTELFWERHDAFDIWRSLQLCFKYRLPPPTNVLAGAGQPHYTPPVTVSPRNQHRTVNQPVLPLPAKEPGEPVPAVAAEPPIKANGKKTVKSIRRA